MAMARTSAAGVHVDDHSQGIHRVLEHGGRGRAYDINGDVELTNRELTAAILESCSATWDMVTMVEDRKGHDRRYSLDDSALCAKGYAPRIPFAAGLRSTVRWYVENRDWWEPLKGQDRSTTRPAVEPSGRVRA
jgi:dTDP-glucose 4,6-dehydratase